MAIREAKLDDIDGIIEVIKKLVGRYPSLRPDWKKIRTHLTEAISSSKHKVLVSIKGEEITGAFVALTAETFWAERQTASIIMFYSEIPGDGMAMLRNFFKWADGRRAIKHIEMNVDMAIDSRIGLLLNRLGMSATDTIYRKLR